MTLVSTLRTAVVVEVAAVAAAAMLCIKFLRLQNCYFYYHHYTTRTTITSKTAHTIMRAIASTPIQLFLQPESFSYVTLPVAVTAVCVRSLQQSASNCYNSLYTIITAGCMQNYVSLYTVVVAIGRRLSRQFVCSWCSS